MKKRMDPVSAEGDGTKAARMFRNGQASTKLSDWILSPPELPIWSSIKEMSVRNTVYEICMSVRHELE